MNFRSAGHEGGRPFRRTLLRTVVRASLAPSAGGHTATVTSDALMNHIGHVSLALAVRHARMSVHDIPSQGGMVASTCGWGGARELEANSALFLR